MSQHLTQSRRKLFHQQHPKIFQVLAVLPTPPSTHAQLRTQNPGASELACLRLPVLKLPNMMKLHQNWRVQQSSSLDPPRCHELSVRAEDMIQEEVLLLTLSSLFNLKERWDVRCQCQSQDPEKIHSLLSSLRKQVILRLGGKNIHQEKLSKNWNLMIPSVVDGVCWVEKYLIKRRLFLHSYDSLNIN